MITPHGVCRFLLVKKVAAHEKSKKRSRGRKRQSVDLIVSIEKDVKIGLFPGPHPDGTGIFSNKNIGYRSDLDI